ncbi:MAG TPA: hypothetical protein VMT35_06335 [Ignavibacteriaceae bacterium]|nr:hypothetical protein [Ignavibacteriaceae bacterium]
MKNLLFLLVFGFTVISYAQYKDPGFPTSHVSDGLINYDTGSLFSFLNSENFSMKHSFSLSYSAFGNQAMSLGVYTNSMFYKFNNNLNAELDVSLVQSPYSTLGKQFQKSIDGFYISKAAVNYKPWNDVLISVQYRNLPYNYYNSYWGFYGDRNFNENFNNDFLLGK